MTVCSRLSGVVIVDKLAFEIAPGEVVSLAGASGSGKTTVALAVAGLLPSALHISGGDITLDRSSLLRLTLDEWRSIRGRAVGTIFQDPSTALNPLYTCGYQLDFAQKLQGVVGAAAIQARSLDRLQACGLSDFQRIYHSLPAEISGGERQRVMFAMATLQKPKLLIADEPTSALDAESAGILAELLRKYVQTGDTAVLLMTHDHARLAEIVTRTVTIGRAVDVAHGLGLPGDSRASSASAPGASPMLRAVNAAFPTLSVRGLSKRFLRHQEGGGEGLVLNNLSFEVWSGEMLAITGPSGVGKTTLGRCLAGLLRPDKGEVLLNQAPLPEHKPGRPFPVQVVYQNPYGSLSPLRTVRATLEEALEASGTLDRGGLARRAAELLAAVKLPEAFGLKFPRQLSGGERQRVAIARCLAVAPQVIVADEPTASLDDANAQSILALFRDIVRRRQIALILITHQLQLADQFSDRMIVLPSSATEAVESLT